MRRVVAKCLATNRGTGTETGVQFVEVLRKLAVSPGRTV